MGMSSIRIVNFGIGVKVSYNSFPMVKIKICGMTNMDDALAAVDAGADALGFVFYRESARAVSRKTAAAIIARLPESVMPVGVFVDEDLNIVRETMTECGLRVAQLHGAESADYCAVLGRSVIKAIRPRNSSDLETMAAYTVGAFLLDAFVPGIPGGTGTCVDWQLVGPITRRYYIILAGGLTAENVREAIRRLRPQGVDVSSGVEFSPGRKDHAKVTAFVTAAREAFANLPLVVGEGNNTATGG
jgi:phosphoribosylanthranilate isomerase